MRIITPVIFSIALHIAASAVEIDDKLLVAIEAVETRPGGTRYTAVGDNGRAYGPLQIHSEAIQDVNRIYGTAYTVTNAFNRQQAWLMARLYLAHWGRLYETRTGKRADYEVLARIWNGGPMGWRKPQTVAYWHRVRKYLDLCGY